MAARPLLVEYFRKNQVIKRGYYARIATAIPRATERLLIEGQPRDVVQISLREHGTLIADVVLKVGGVVVIRTEAV